MGRCFKLLGKAKKEQKAVDCTGSAFFVAEHYLLTCKHNVSALSLGDELSVCYGKNKYSAELMDTAEDWDLALLYTETSAEEDWIFLLDRIATEGREAIAYGYPHGGVLDEQRGLVIGTELDNGVANLTNANGVTIGFSGGPVCLTSDKGTAVGVIITIKGRDEFGRQVETAGFVHTRVGLELWGEQYNLCEKHYEERTDAYGGNSFVYSERKTDFQDPYNYLEQLQSFLNDDRPVLWWAVVGPGGSGKSRLCLELALSLNSNWCCEPLRSSQLNKANLQNLYEKAGRDFLLLADYAYADTGKLGDWLDERARARDAKNSPRIRVLLLQRERGRKDFGWQQSLMRGHGNLINLRYQEDLELAVLVEKEMTALMRSYAENEAGRQINAEELYEVLQSVDPGLTRPLFAMFIVDAELRGDDPRGWDPEKALAYFTQREKDVVDRAFLDRPEDASAAKLLFALATICGGFAFYEGILDSSPLNGIQEFMELQDINNFGSRMKKARLAERNHKHYTVKALKPDLLGEYYVLDCFREMMNDSLQRESVSIILRVAYEVDSAATGDFLRRLFTDYETDVAFACLCCGEDNWFHANVSWGLVMRPNVALLYKLYRRYGTKSWLEQFAKGLVKSIGNQNDPEKAEELLEELRGLHRDEPGNVEVFSALAAGLSGFIDKQTDPEKTGELLEELRGLHRDEPGNMEVTEELAVGLLRTIYKQTDPEKTGELLEELRGLHRNEIGNAMVTFALAAGLPYVIKKQTDPEKTGELLEELRGLHRDEPGNTGVTFALAAGLSCVINKQTDPEKTRELLEELRGVHRDEPGNAGVTEKLAFGLLITIDKQTDPEKTGELIEELRGLHRNEPGNAEVTFALAAGLSCVIKKQTDPEKAGELLEELRGLHRDEPGNIEVVKQFAIGLIIAATKQVEPEKAGELLEELRGLQK